VDIIGNYWQPPVAGQGSLDLDGNTDGQISQALSGLVFGQKYALTFALSGNPDGSPTTKTVQVSINGLNQTFTFNDSGTTRPSPMNYAFESLTFTYNGSAYLALPVWITPRALMDRCSATSRSLRYPNPLLGP
jgi:Protein of unknown function (DUF642)